MTNQPERKPTWMKIHSGLNEPKHREALGKRIWLFMHFIDKADWETGIVKNYTDSQGAEDMQMSQNTIRTWRRELVALGYISCRKAFQSQDIVIHKWRNPREVSPEQINVIEGEGSEITGVIETDPPLRRQSDHPSIESHLLHNTPPKNGGEGIPQNGDKPIKGNPWLDKICELWETEKPRAGTLLSLLVGKSKKHAPCNIAPPVTDLAELETFARWYKRAGNGCDMPKSPEVLHEWFNKFRHSQEASIPAPAPALDYTPRVNRTDDYLRLQEQET